MDAAQSLVKQVSDVDLDALSWFPNEQATYEPPVVDMNVILHGIPNGNSSGVPRGGIEHSALQELLKFGSG